MVSFLIRRLIEACLTMLAAVALVFVAIRILPGNPVLARYGQHAVPDKVAEEMAANGWDKPVLVQLKNFFADLLLRGDLGESFSNVGESVTDGLLAKFPATVELTLFAMLIAIPIGILAGIAAAVWRNRFPDYLCMTGSLLGVSIPVFLLGLCLISMFQNMPTGSRLPKFIDYPSTTGFYLIESLLRGDFEIFALALRHILLPALALSSIPMAIIARMTRTTMIEVLSSDYVRTAKAKGGTPWRVVMRHAFPNASIPIANIAGYQIGMLLTGAVLTETVFSWPGLGFYLVEAVKSSDYAVVQGAALLIAALFVVTNLLLDIFYAWLDPRVRVDGK